MRFQWRLKRQRVRESLLFWPVLAIPAAVVVAALLTRLPIEPGGAWTAWLIGGSVTDARGMLTTIAFILFNGISLLLALAIVVFHVIGVQYSPRLLYNALGDRGIHVVLAVGFLFFVYVMAVLYWMSGTGTVYPQLAATIGVFLVFPAFAGLIYMINRLAQWLRLSRVVAHSGRKTAAMMARHPTGIGRQAGFDIHPANRDPETSGAVAIPAQRSGYLLALDDRQLLKIACRHDVVVRIAPAIGDYLVGGATPLAWVWTEQGGPGAPAQGGSPLTTELANAVTIDFEQVTAHDVAFGLRQLVDTALRANNPPGKDPSTVAQCVNWLRFLVVELSRLPLGDEVLHDSEHTPRLVLTGRDYSEYLEIICHDICLYGLADTQVALALLQALDEAAAIVTSEQRRRALAHQLQSLMATFEERFPDAGDQIGIHDRALRLRRALETTADGVEA